ncbi:MAG: hypothetical protein Q9159_005442 [Coniocarpon cinnabarinum]
MHQDWVSSEPHQPDQRSESLGNTSKQGGEAARFAQNHITADKDIFDPTTPKAEGHHSPCQQACDQDLTDSLTERPQSSPELDGGVALPPSQYTPTWPNSTTGDCGLAHVLSPPRARKIFRYRKESGSGWLVTSTSHGPASKSSVSGEKRASDGNLTVESSQGGAHTMTDWNANFESRDTQAAAWPSLNETQQVALRSRPSTSGNAWNKEPNGTAGTENNIHNSDAWNADNNNVLNPSAGHNWTSPGRGSFHGAQQLQHTSSGVTPRATSRASSRGGWSRRNSMRPQLVPNAVLAQSQGTFNSAKASYEDGNMSSEPIRYAAQPTGVEHNSWSHDRSSSNQKKRGGKRQSKWPTSAEVKAPPKLDSDLEREQDMIDAVDLASAQADPGDGKGGIIRPILPGQDTSLDIRDWTGGWAPAPADWEERPMFLGTPVVTTVYEWDDGYDQQVCTPTAIAGEAAEQMIPCRQVRCPDQEDFVHAKGEICDPQWVLEKIDNGAVDGSWRAFAEWWAAMQRFPLGGDVVKDSDDTNKPYWERFTGGDHHQLMPLQVPEARVDPGDNDITRVQSQTSAMSMARINNEHLRKANKAKRDKRNAIQRQREMDNYVPEPNEHSPKMNIYLRPAEPTDAPSIQEVYNYWVEQSVFAPEMSGLSRHVLQERISDTLEDGLPWIVAVDRTASKKGPVRGPRARQNTQPDRIVGFAFADEYMAKDSMFRYTVEVECYVRPDCVRKGIGRTLMDKLMSVLDLEYPAVGGYEFICDNEEMKNKYVNGGARVVDRVIIQLSHVSDDRSKLDWNAKWLTQRWGFQQKGYLDEIGRKLSSKVSVATLVYVTSANVPKVAF